MFGRKKEPKQVEVEVIATARPMEEMDLPGPFRDHVNQAAKNAAEAVAYVDAIADRVTALEKATKAPGSKDSRLQALEKEFDRLAEKLRERSIYFQRGKP